MPKEEFKTTGSFGVDDPHLWPRKHHSMKKIPIARERHIPSPEGMLVKSMTHAFPNTDKKKN